MERGVAHRPGSGSYGSSYYHEHRPLLRGHVLFSAGELAGLSLRRSAGLEFDARARWPPAFATTSSPQGYFPGETSSPGPRLPGTWGRKHPAAKRCLQGADVARYRSAVASPTLGCGGRITNYKASARFEGLTTRFQREAPRPLQIRSGRGQATHARRARFTNAVAKAGAFEIFGPALANLRRQTGSGSGSVPTARGSGSNRSRGGRGQRKGAFTKSTEGGHFQVLAAGSWRVVQKLDGTLAGGPGRHQ